MKTFSSACARARLAVPAICFVFVLLGLAFELAIPFIWHAKFYVDGLRLIHTEPQLEAFGGSFSSTAWIYSPIFDLLRLLGVDLNLYGVVFDANWIFANEVFAIIYLIAFGLVVKFYGMPLRAGGVALLFVVLVLYSPYYAAINKDVIPFIFSCWAVIVVRQRSLRVAVVGTCSGLFLYGIFVREYFILITAMLLLAHFVSYRLRAIVFCYAIAIVAIYFLFRHVPVDVINIGRSDYLADETNSRIRYFFDDTLPIGFISNRLCAFIRISFPVELCLLSPAYIVFVLFRCYASVLAIAGMFRSNSMQARFFSHAILAYSAVQALFEPDFGSAFRHFMAALPFVCALYATTRSTVSQEARPIGFGRYQTSGV